ncbi:TPA: phosphoglycerate kinase [Candidatus Nomurabacteria bacterium]|nr:MAG: Phosphoglycerate kinase [Parcubacteria bacterium RAAC4_OD1_1]HCY26098.1 phosphoglycerate kinase [Candidatus Nomurabacteria bacterium]
MKNIKEIKNIKGKKILIRVDFNVPLKGDAIVDDFRIKSAIPTISYLQKNGGKLILLSHIGEDGEKSLFPVFKYLKKKLKDIYFAGEKMLSDDTLKMIDNMKNGEIILLENIRRENGEKENSVSFARGLSRYGDIYVNDAFSVSHRSHASVVGIPKFLDSYAGLQLESEVKNLSKAFEPPQPFLFILGGAKFETKIPLINKFIKKADTLFVGGAIANDFIKMKGFEVGESVVSPDISVVKKFLRNPNLVVPTDVILWDGNKSRNAKIDEVKKNEIIFDIGLESLSKLKELISKSKFVLWNGPLGKYENNFGGGTEEILKFIAKSKTTSIIGGGDTASLVNKLKLQDKFTFVSTGGGSTLDFLANGTLPGIKALK